MLASHERRTLTRYQSQKVTELLDSQHSGPGWAQRLTRWLPIGRWLGMGRNRSEARGMEMEAAGADENEADSVDFRTALYRCMLGDTVPDETQTDTLERCWAWYLEYLDAQIRESWNAVLTPVLSGLEDNAPSLLTKATYFDQLAKVYQVLVIIAQALRSRPEVSLENILDELKSKREQYLRPDADKDLARQMIWLLSGSLTFLYDPQVSNSQASRSQFKLREPMSSRRARGRHGRKPLTSYSEPITRADEQLYTMLAQFGKLLPEPENIRAATPAAGQQDDRHINLAYVSIDGLKKVAKIKIEWVNTMNLHMQLDQRKRVLRLFRFPGFCRLMWNDQEDCFLGQLFTDHRRSRLQSSPSTNGPNMNDYLREILISYRILFGINKTSRKAFRNELDSWQNDNTHSSPISSRRYYDTDPLLYELCTSPSPSTSSIANPTSLSSLLELLDGEETSAFYALEDFPFLGRRLAELQRFSMRQKPNDWWMLWQDRRDVQNWWIVWTAWAVLLFTGWTVVLQFFQLVVQVWSMVIS